MNDKKNDNNTLVSVVMPVYNDERFIKDAVDSILNQTMPFFEFIIVDDGSSDNTRKQLQEFSDTRIKLLLNDKNRGIAYSTNRAIEESKGKYIALMDDDDISVLDRLERQVNYLERHSEIDILGGNSELIDENGQHIGCRVPPRNNPKYIKSWLLFRNVDFSNATAMIRHDFINKNGLSYREGCLGMQDYRFYVDSSKVGNISAVDNVVLRNRRHKENETKKQMINNAASRAALYNEIRRESLQMSGYKLSDEQLSVIDQMISEEKPHFTSVEDYENLYGVFRDIIRQAHEMEVNYYEELRYVLKRLLSDCVYHSDLFQ